MLLVQGHRGAGLDLHAHAAPRVTSDDDDDADDAAPRVTSDDDDDVLLLLRRLLLRPLPGLISRFVFVLLLLLQATNGARAWAGVENQTGTNKRRGGVDGVERSKGGFEWSGVEWMWSGSGVEWSGVEWRGCGADGWMDG